MRLLLALLLLASAGSVAAQEKKEESKAEPPQERPAPGLNLKLENPGQYAREAPPEEGKAEALPSLGSNARPIPTTPLPTTTRPFPADSERAEPR